MTCLTRQLLCAIGVVLALLHPAHALQPGGERGGTAARGEATACVMNVPEATMKVRPLTQGRILAASPQRTPDGKCRLRVKTLSEDGRVRIQTFDPRKPPNGR